MTVPAWKLALLEKKHQREEEERKRQEEEEAKLEIIPAWKRDLLLRKRSGAQVNSWRVTPKAGNVSTTHDLGNKTVRNSAVNVKPGPSIGVGVVSNVTVVDHATTQEKKPTVGMPKDDGVSEEHCSSVHDNPFLRQERKRLSSVGEDSLASKRDSAEIHSEVIAVNMKPSINTKAANNANNNTILNKTESSTTVHNNYSSLNKTHKPEVIIIPKHRPEQPRVVPAKQPTAQKLTMDRRSLSPSPKEKRQFVFKDAEPELNAETLTSPDNEQFEHGRVNKLLGLFGKPASQDDLVVTRMRKNSLDRNHKIMKPAAYSNIVSKGSKQTKNQEQSEKLPISVNQYKETVVVNTTAGYEKPVDPPKADAPKPPQEPNKSQLEPTPKPRKKKTKLDASTIIRLDNEEPANYAHPRVLSLARKKENEKKKEESQDVRSVKLNKSGTISMSQFDQQQNAESVTIPAISKRQAPPPPTQITFETHDQPSQNASANITIVTKESASPGQISWNGTNEAAKTNNDSVGSTSELADVRKQTITMTHVDKQIKTEKQTESNSSTSEVRKAVEELKSVGTTFHVTPKIHKFKPKSSAPPVPESQKPISLSVGSKQNHIDLYKNDDTDSIPVSNIDDLLTPPSLPEKMPVSVVNSGNSNKNHVTKPFENGNTITIDANTGKIESPVKEKESPVEVVKTPLRRLAGGKVKKVLTYSFTGENAATGKPSMLIKSKNNKLSISFNDSGTVKHVYPSEESLLEDDEADDEFDTDYDFDQIRPAPKATDDTLMAKAPLKSNTVLHSSGGLQNYTPTYLQDAYQSSLEKRTNIQDAEPEKPKEEVDFNDVEVKPLDDNDADYFSTSSSSSALLF
uniref:Flocculation protein FLO11-like n=1 Tax=Saccoglossus kowalevskii TaxID=10224 RepID=A0ABM0MRB8_SACKO|nr:PREDICTED: flocculation protein FLO11-like [Saccoglossus kowalevskii]